MGKKSVHKAPPKGKENVHKAPLRGIESMQSTPPYNKKSHQLLYLKEILTQKLKED